MVLLTKIPIGLARGIRGIIACPDPVSIQLAAGVDDLGYRFGYRSAATREGTAAFTASNVPLTTWLRHPAAGLHSCRWHLWAFAQYEAGPQPEDPIDKLREWSARYGMVNPDDLNLARGGRR